METTTWTTIKKIKIEKERTVVKGKSTSCKGKQIDKLSFIRIKDFCCSRDTTKGVKRQAPEREKTCVINISKKELEHQKYKELYKSRRKEANSTIENG